MQTIVVRCPAKLNLTFNICGLRPDGYHNVETVFQSISLEDELIVSMEKNKEFEFKIECDHPALKKQIPLDDSNLIGKAAKAFLAQQKTRSNYKILVKLEKKIPVGAGLAGGSTDAAGMLIAMNRFFGDPLNLAELQELGASFGSDIPFCLEGGTCIGRGRGELLEKLESNLQLCYCIVKPRKLSVSTPWAFKAFDQFESIIPPPDSKKTIMGLLSADAEQALAGFGNVFEPVVFAAHPELAELKTELLKQGAWACHMTGSGPTLFAVVSGKEMGQHIRRHILRDDDIGFSYLTEEILQEAVPPIDFKLAESSTFGARIIS